MFVHIVALHWKPGVSAAQRLRARTDILALKDRIAEILDLYLGENVSPRSARYTLSGVVLFQDRAAFDAYQTHPHHLGLLDWLGPLVEPIEIDFASPPATAVIG